jgi:hypothetical protein
MRNLFSGIGFRRQQMGTFQVGYLPTLDFAVPLRLYTPANVVLGSVRDRVVALNGIPTVRPTALLYSYVDHRLWAGEHTAIFLPGVRSILENGTLRSELPDSQSR